MEKNKKTVVIGFLGTNLDAAAGDKRWSRWRPTVSLCRHADLPIDRLELIYDEKYEHIANQVIADIGEVSPETQAVRHIANLANPWDFEEVYAALLDIADNTDFNTDQESYLVHMTTGTHVAQICLFLMAEARYFPARLLQTAPQPGKQRAPGSYTIIDLDLKKYDKLAMRFELEQRQATSFLKSGIETRNAAFNAMIDEIEQVAIRSRAPILMTGPTGAGKSRLVRQIFELKKARNQVNGPLVEVNCATLRGEGAMSALFGHRKGAFTGAAADRPGLIKSADQGVLFLDEIGELALDEQAMILRAVEEGAFLPLGADKESSSAFQLIAGTNRDLSAEVAQGRFREDLLARLNLWTFRLPALAERCEDIEPNIDFELRRFAREHSRQVSFNSEARQRYIDFATSPGALWLANFRDLSASITRLATLADGGRIREADVIRETGRLSETWRREDPTDDAAVLTRFIDPISLAGLDPFDRPQLAHVIETCQASTSLSDAGRKLFASSRQTKKSANDADRLRKYLGKFGLAWKDLADVP